MLLNPRTLALRLISIRHWHTYQAFPDPTANPVVNKTLTGIARTHEKPKTKAHPLTPESLAKIAEYLHQQSTLSSIRDNALLQIGYFGALRRSELVNIHVEHIRWTTEGIEILLPRSKTDQSSEGQFCVIPYGNSLLCPVTALKNWLEKSEIQEGAVFRPIQRGERIGTSSLTPLSINLIVQKCANAINLPERSIISSHSLRRGLATSASRCATVYHHASGAVEID